MCILLIANQIRRGLENLLPIINLILVGTVTAGPGLWTTRRQPWIEPITVIRAAPAPE